MPGSNRLSNTRDAVENERLEHLVIDGLSIVSGVHEADRRLVSLACVRQAKNESNRLLILRDQVGIGPRRRFGRGVDRLQAREGAHVGVASGTDYVVDLDAVAHLEADLIGGDATVPVTTGQARQ